MARPSSVHSSLITGINASMVTIHAWQKRRKRTRTEYRPNWQLRILIQPAHMSNSRESRIPALARDQVYNHPAQLQKLAHDYPANPSIAVARRESRKIQPQIADGLLQRKHNRKPAIWQRDASADFHLHFFHLNRNSSGILIKVDFDLTMTSLAHSLYRLLASELPVYSYSRAQSLFGSFIENFGDIVVGKDEVIVKMNRMRSLPLLRERIPYLDVTYDWLGGKRLVFTANSHT